MTSKPQSHAYIGNGTNSRTVRRNGWGKGVKLCLSLCKRGNDLRILKSLLLIPLIPFFLFLTEVAPSPSGEWEGGEVIPSQGWALETAIHHMGAVDCLL